MNSLLDINILNITLQNILIFSLILFLLFLIAKYKLKEIQKKRLQKKRFERGSKLESKAKKYLVSLGYNIVYEQYVCKHKYKVNGIENISKLILDYVVSKGGKQYIVEVKSGKSAIHVKNKDSRRQLLEYDFVLENDGIFLLDMENKNMQLVEFFPKVKHKTNNYVVALITIIAIVNIFIPILEIKIVSTTLLIILLFRVLPRI